jgi:uracil-DNA glycosylase
MRSAQAGQARLEFDTAEPERLLHWEPDPQRLAEGWRPLIDDFLASEAGLCLASFLRERLAAGATIYPPRPFRALEITPLPRVRAVVLGQDPYHGTGQAEGLAFSVRPGVRLPPSLRNIFRELRGGVEGPAPAHGSLVSWAEQGVLLLNTSLTVEEGKPGSHARQGWEILTDRLLAAVAANAAPCAYLLWGAHAQAKAGMISETAARHGREALILQANHPSPLSARRAPQPFLGCGHFALARGWLEARGQPGFFPVPVAPARPLPAPGRNGAATSTP